MLGASHVSLQLQFFDHLLNGSTSYVTLLGSSFLALGPCTALGFRKPIDAWLAVDLVAVGAHLDFVLNQHNADLLAAAAAFRVVFDHSLAFLLLEFGLKSANVFNRTDLILNI